jgi:hypothetical protein
MKLPAMKYGSGDIRKTLSVFGGLNRRIGAGDGELIHCENLGANTYPALSPRAGRGLTETYTEPSDIFEWNGHKVIVDGFNLLLDGRVIANVSEGSKQFAVVNTKLVVWPDKIYYNFEDNSVYKMDVSAVADSADPSSYTTNTLTLGESDVHAKGSEKFTTVQYRYSYGTNDIYVYAKTYSALKWENGAWVGEGETETEISSGWTGKFIKLRANSVSGVYNLNVRSEEKVNRFGQGTETHVIKEYGEDMGEYYAEIVSAKRATNNPAPETVYIWTVEFRVISPVSSGETLSDLFDEGDWVKIKGVPGVSESKEYKLLAIDDETRTLTFPENTFVLLGDYYYKLPEAKTKAWTAAYCTIITPPSYADGTPIPGKYTRYGFKLPALPEGSVLYSDKEIPASSYTPATVKAWNSKTGEVTEVSAEVIASGIYNGGTVPEDNLETITFLANAGILDGAVEVSKGVPGMDFICAHNNRLYGVSNSANALNEDGTRNENYKTRVIYVSELGIPNRFTTFEGVDTDSYQVAEASNSDFTACISYGDLVLFFKEHKVLKFYGDYPSNMGYTYDDIEGVKKGCHKSMVIANEVLYYMGRAGMCAYTGSVPQIISYKLDREYEDVVCGTDGKKLLMCGRYGDEREVLSYNIAEGIWLKEDNAEIKAMALIDGRLHMLAGNKELADGEGDEKVKWSAEFHPFTEETFERKRYKYIRVRAELEAGTVIRVCAKIGDGEYETWYTAENSGWQTITVPMPLMRVDRVSLKIEGEGKAIVRDIQRLYQKGSER